MKRIDPRIEAILLKDWDPIGINDDPHAANEYSSYALQILGMLHRGATEQQIVDFLAGVVVDKMELKPDKENARAVARKLVALKVSKSET